jgi:hypothetical protein
MVRATDMIIGGASIFTIRKLEMKEIRHPVRIVPMKSPGIPIRFDK